MFEQWSGWTTCHDDYTEDYTTSGSKCYRMQEAECKRSDWSDWIDCKMRTIFAPIGKRYKYEDCEAEKCESKLILMNLIG